jgi:hypothetical protein
MLVGRVSVTGTERPTGSIVARWQATYNNGSPVTVGNDVGRAVAVNGAEQHVDLDDQGRFVVCGVARGRPIHLRYSEKERFADTTIVVSDTLLHPVQWRPMISAPKSNPFETFDVESGEPMGEPLDVSPRQTRKPEIRGIFDRRRKQAAR